MVIRLGTSVAALAAALALGAAARAHHSAAAFDTAAQITVEGTVVEYDWKNPHVYFTLAVAGPDGSTIEQDVEAGAGSVLLPLGLTPQSLKPGEHVIVQGNPNKRGEGHVILGREVLKDDGSVLPLNIASRSVRPAPDETAESIEGVWFAPFSAFGSIAGARRNWKLTPAAQGAIASYDAQVDSTHAQCIPIGEPALMLYPVATVIDVTDETVSLYVDWMTSERTVHLNQTEHPADLEPSLHGHSIGHWEGETLVVDTVGFALHREGFGFGMPSSEGKHLMERFSVAEDGKHLVYEATFEDPMYLEEPGSLTAELDYRPDLTPTREACDLAVAQRYQEEEAR
jgi:hypothetical protein